MSAIDSHRGMGINRLGMFEGEIARFKPSVRFERADGWAGATTNSVSATLVGTGE